MFKRVEKRRRRQEEVEELGLNDELKQILGIQDTDSEESDSGSNSSDDGGSDDDDDDGGFPEAQLGDSDGEDDQDSSKPLPSFLVKLTIEQALRESIIAAPEDPRLSFCVLCPYKTLRSETTVEVHRSSNAHKRRLAQFIKHSKGVDPAKEALSVIEEHMQPKGTTFVKPPTQGKSKRALKKEASQALRKANREKARARAKAKKQAGDKWQKPANSEIPPTPTSRKKRRQDKSDTLGKLLSSGEPVVTAATNTKSSLPKKKRQVQDKGVADNSDKPVVEETKPLAVKSLYKPTPTVTATAPSPSIKSIVRTASHGAQAQSRKAKP